MFGILDWFKFGTGALIGALVAGTLGYWGGYWTGTKVGYQQRLAEVAIADAQAELERKGDAAKIQTLSDYELCVDGLRSSGMPIDACEQLRRVRED